VGMSNPSAPFSKLRRANVKKDVPRQANYSIRPLAQYQTPWHQAPY